MTNNFKIGDCMELFFLDVESRCSKTTLVNYRWRLKYFLDFLSESGFATDDVFAVALDALTVNHLRLYAKMLRSKHRFDNTDTRPTQDTLISNTTVRDYCSDLSAFLAWCYRNDYMSKDITKNWQIVGRERKEVLPLYQSEVDRIDACWSTKSETSCRNLAMIHCMLDAGLRSGEVVRLKVTDVSFDKNYISIVGSKGGRSRYVKMSYRLKQYMFKYFHLYRSACGDSSVDSFFLMVGSSNCNPITSNVVKQLFARLKVKVDIPRLKPHLLRHTFASAFICQGGNLEHLRLLLGHSNISISENYIHIAYKWESFASDIYKLDEGFMNSYR